MRSLIAALALATLAASPVFAQTSSTPQIPPPPSPASVIGRQITLEEAVAIGLQGQPQILSRLFDYQAARFRVDQALSPLLPQLTGTFTAMQTETPAPSTRSRRLPGGRILQAGSFTHESVSPFDPTAASISLSQLLFDFGKNFATTDAARKTAEVALENVELQRQLIALAVKQGYTNMLFSQRLIRVNQQALERADLNLRSARGFFEVGTRPKSDVTRAEVDVANARVDVIRARNAERTARVALNIAMGLPVDTPTQIVDNLAYQAVTIDRVQLQSDALKQRPEYRQAKLRVDTQEAAFKRTFLDFFPDITAGGFYGGSRGDLNETWQINLNLTWTVFDGMNRVAKYREAKANLESTRAQVLQSELDIARDVETSIIAVEEAQERIQAAQKAVESAQENFRLAQGRFDAGVGTILELTDAQLALTQANNLETQALADYRNGLAALDRSVGRR